MDPWQHLCRFEPEPNSQTSLSGFQSDHEFFTYMEGLFRNPGFQEYLGIDTKSCKDCSEASPCLKCENDQLMVRTNSSTYEPYYIGFVSAFRDKLSKQQKSIQTEFSQGQTILMCPACWCTMYRYDPNRPKTMQHIQTFSVLWSSNQTCKTPKQLARIVCRGCYFLYEICGQDFQLFRLAVQIYFRKNGSVIKKSMEQQGLDRPAMDRPKYFASIFTKSHIPHSSIPLGVVKSCWAMQIGLVSYPLMEIDLNQHFTEIERTYQWTMGRCINMHLEDHHNPDQEHENLKLAIRLDQATHEWVPCTMDELRQIDINERLRWCTRQINDLEKYQVYWIPIDPSSGAPAMTAMTLVPKNQNQPLSPYNFLITTKYLAALEARFGRVSVLEWLNKVSFANTRHTREMLKDFIQLRFEIDPQVIKPPRAAIDLGENTLPSTWMQIAQESKIQSKDMETFFNVLQKLRRECHEYHELEQQLEPLAAEYKHNMLDLKALEHQTEQIEQDLEQELQPLQHNIRAMDILAHVGIQLRESKRKCTPSSFDKLSRVDQLKIMRQILLDLDPNLSEQEVNQQCVNFLDHLCDEQTLNQFHEPQIVVQNHLYPKKAKPQQTKITGDALSIYNSAGSVWEHELDLE